METCMTTDQYEAAKTKLQHIAKRIGGARAKTYRLREKRIDGNIEFFIGGEYAARHYKTMGTCYAAWAKEYAQ